MARRLAGNRLPKAGRQTDPPQLPDPQTSPTLGSNPGSKKSAPPETLAQLIQEQAKTGDTSRIVANQLARETAGLPPGKLTAAIANTLIERWRTDYAGHTAARYRRQLARLLRQLEAHGCPPSADKLNAIRQPGPRTTIPTDQEVAAMFAAAEPAMNLWLLLTTQLGLRFTEASTLAPEHYDPDTKTIHIRTKGDQAHTLPVTTEIEQAIGAVPTTANPTIPYYGLLTGPSKRGTYATSPENIRDRWKLLLKMANIARNIRPHDLRRYAAVRLYRETHDILAVQKLLGHQTLLSTCLYLTPHDPEALRPILERLKPPFERINQARKIQ